MTAALFLLTLFVALYGRILGIDGVVAAGLSVKNLLLGLCLASIGISLSLRKVKLDFPIAVLGPFALAALMAAASIIIISAFALRTPYSEASAIISFKAKLADPLLMLLIGYFSVQTTNDAIKILRVYLLMILIGCALTLIDFFNVPDLGIISARDDDGRIEGFIGSAGEFATIVAASMPLLVYSTGWSSASGRIIVLMCAVVMATCVIIAATRAPVLGLMSAWIVYAYFISKKGLSNAVTGSLVMVAMVTLLLLGLSLTPYWSTIESRFLTGVASGNMFEITSGRTLIWSKVMTEMWKHPESFIIGMGWDVYFQSIGHRYATHSIYLDRFYSQGIFGLLLYIIAYSYCLKMLLSRSGAESTQAYKIRLPAGLCLVIFLVSAMFADLEKAEFFVYAIVGIGLRYLVLLNKKNEAPQSDTGFPIRSINVHRT